jgi:diadenosine tetraphosphate (Ap4A) HIT family hydrolase
MYIKYFCFLKFKKGVYMSCHSCSSISGKNRISPADTIYEGKYWVIEHAYPTSLKGWLVIVLKRHAEKLHELSEEEFIELSKLQYMVIQRLKECLDYEKEYVVCFGEGSGFAHIHFHIIPKPKELADELKAGKIFAFLHPSEDDKLEAEDVIDFCEDFKKPLCEFMKVSIENLECRWSTVYWLKKSGIESIGQLLLYSETELLKMPNVQSAMITELREILGHLGVTLRK